MNNFERTSTQKQTSCYKHYCRACGTIHHIPVSKKEYPRCCGENMAFLGIVDAIPGRAESDKKNPQ